MFPFLLYPFLLNFVVNGFDRNDVVTIFISSFILISYFYFLYQKLETFRNQFWVFFFYAVLLRCFVLGSTPHLSDDIYRYLFDAKILFYGFSPYQMTPIEWISANSQFGEELVGYLEKMNSAGYFSVYPIFLLLHFIVSSILNFLLDTTFLGVQFLFMVFDILNLYLIRKFYPNESLHFYWMYYANPLVIIEGISQMHPEMLMLPWLLFLLHSKSIWTTGGLFFFGSQIKINFLLYLLGISRQKRSILAISIFVFTSLAIWKWTVFANLQAQGTNGIGLFFHSFRFAGILEPLFYFPLSFLGFSYLSGSVSLFVLGLIFLYLFFHKRFFDLLIKERMFILYLLFLVLSPVIHPWYWIPLVMLGHLNRLSLEWHSFVVSLAFFSYFIYASDLFFYIYWAFAILGFSFYGIQEINHLRKTTNSRTRQNETG